MLWPGRGLSSFQASGLEVQYEFLCVRVVDKFDPVAKAAIDNMKMPAILFLVAKEFRP